MGMRMALVCCVSILTFGQTFDVASVKLHQESNPLGTMMQELPGRIQYRRINLLAVLRRAYNVEPQQIIGPADNLGILVLGRFQERRVG